MPDHLRDGRDVLIHFDLQDLSDVHSRINVWIWQNRATRAYSDVYQPTHFAEINRPE
jgi:hypothetical protein